MSGDLISRKALLEFAQNHVSKMIDCNDIARFPAVDAEPVRHGKWIGCHDDYIRRDGKMQYYRYYQCENCYRRTAVKSNYCPNCGARMYVEVSGDADD